MKARWLTVALAVAAATAFAISVHGGTWWSTADVEIGPFGSTQCFASECRPAGLSWIGAGDRFVRTGKGAWAGGLVAGFMLLVVAAGVASGRRPSLAAKTALVAIATALAAGVWFIIQFPGVDGATYDRGVLWFAAAIAGGTIAAVLALRAPVRLRPATAPRR